MNKNQEQEIKENYFVAYALNGPTNPKTGVQSELPIGLNPYPRYDTNCTTYTELLTDPTCIRRRTKWDKSIPGVT